MIGAGESPPAEAPVVAICGGVGGAKLAAGLARIVPALTVIVNTGDDFEHLGLRISPDLDTVLYTLAGLANRELGWGRADESWKFMETLGALGGETWFRLGDRDLAIHLERTRRLRSGERLTELTKDFAARLGVSVAILPMSDEPVGTIVETPAGDLPFQRYFVERRCEPEVRGLRFDGAASAFASAEVRAALAAPDLRAIIICPSNPYLSIDPILAVPGIRELVMAAKVPVVAVSPIIGGKAVKGPTVKIMAELRIPATSRAIADHYGGLIDGLVIDTSDESEAGLLGLPVEVTRTLMLDDEDRRELAAAVLAFADRLAVERVRSGEAVL